MKEEVKTEETMGNMQWPVPPKESPDNSGTLLSDCDAEAEEVRRMKEACDRMAHEMLEQIDMLIMKIDGILARDRELYQIDCAKNLSLEEREFLIHGNTKLEA